MSSFFDTHSTEIFAIINLLIGGILVPMIGVWLRNHMTNERAARVEQAIQSGLNVAINTATQGKGLSATAEAVINDPTTRNEVVSIASEYVRSTVPSAVDKLKLDPELEQVVSARIDKALAELTERLATTTKLAIRAERVQNNFA